MESLTAPRAEQIVALPGGRQIGLSEFGIPCGKPFVWFHGTPGGGRQVPESVRRAATERGVRLVVIERPGYGRSTPHRYHRIRDVTDDVVRVLDAIGVGRFGLGALSGGGPYALAVAHDLPDRVVSAAVLGGVVPHVGPEALAGGAVALLAPLAGTARLLYRPIGRTFSTAVRLIEPFATPVFNATAKLFPEGDRLVFARADMKEMFLDDLIRSARGGLAGPALDLAVFAEDWGFRLADVTVPVHFWQGDADPIVTIEQARHMAAIVPGSTFYVRPGESHLGGFAAATDALEAVLADWQTAERPRRRTNRT